MTYFETFVAPVPRDKLDAYFALAAQMAPLDGKRMIFGGFVAEVEG